MVRLTCVFCAAIIFISLRTVTAQNMPNSNSWVQCTTQVDGPWLMTISDNRFLDQNYYSDNGINWIQIIDPTDVTYWINNVGYGGGAFILTGAANELWRSVDFSNWSDVSNPGGYDDLTQVIYATNTFIVQRYWDTSGVLVSKDNGVTWTYVSTGYGAGTHFINMTYGNNMFLHCLGNIVRQSTDGLTWSETNPQNPYNFNFTYLNNFANGVFFGASEISRSNGNIQILSACSTNGTSWLYNQGSISSTASGPFYSTGAFGNTWLITSAPQGSNTNGA